ncbi:MAG: Subtilisin-like serine protease-like protein [Microvirga sp.]|jgi:subtilisin family serine protease|nr:Subtilisin-like serine protease-like protein [Microvirga sp.]
MRELLLACAVIAITCEPSASQTRQPPAQAAEQLQTFGAVRLIVRVAPVPAIGGLSAPSAAEIATETVSAANLIEVQLLAPQLARAVVREQGLAEMLSNQRVTEVYVDTFAEPYLQESLPIINAQRVWAQGNIGSGFAVAVLDSGVDRAHVALAGKVVQEACFSSNDAAFGSETLCPSGREEEIGSGAAIPCPAQIRACDHGTHVAGIAAGAAGLHNNRAISGAAPGSPIIAIQVFSRFRNPRVCGSASPCIRSWSSDQIKALQHVRTISAQRPVAAVNMSLGSGRATTTCDENPMKADIDQLRQLGIATIIAAGNDAFPDALGEPACISTAISVGATNDADQIATSFSNRAAFLSVMAPGDDIISTVPGGYGLKAGTSMATPHVAGTWALIRTAQPQASVDQILAVLRSTGKAIRDPSVTANSYQRINAEAAVQAIRGTVSPAGAGTPVPGTGVTSSSGAPAPIAGAAERVIIPTPPGTKAGDLLNAIEPSKAGNAPITINSLPGPNNRFSITAPRDAIQDLRAKGFAPVPQGLSAPQ